MLRGFAPGFVFDSAFVGAQHAAPHLGEIAPLKLDALCRQKFRTKTRKGNEVTKPAPTKPKKVVLAYSGGLDTSIIIPWLKENYGCEVVAVCGDIGQGTDELTGLEEKARKTGASEVHVADMREEFVADYLWKMVRAGGEYEHKYL